MATAGLPTPGAGSSLSAAPAPAETTDIRPATIGGTVTDADNEIVPGATVLLQGPDSVHTRSVLSGDNGFFQFTGLRPGIPYRVVISARGLVSWRSPPMILAPGQFFFLKESKLHIAGGETSVTVYSSPQQIAREQVMVAEQQRVFGFIPNFYAVYDSHPVPLTARLKYRLAFHAATDPIIFAGTAFVAAAYQASNRLDYGQGFAAYSKRLGASYANASSSILLGGAVLPSLLHQDPRYYYKGTGSARSRLFHAIASPFLCKGDNGRLQPNVSSIGGDLAAGALTNAYYPAADRGAGLLFQNFLITSSGRMMNAALQEFVLRRFTPGARN